MKQAQILPLMKFLENEAFVQAKTPHGFINYHCICKTVKVNELWGFLNKCYFDSLCQKGCTNYSQKWSCPPYAPNFKKYSQGYTYLTAIVLKVSVNEFDYIKNSYLKIKAANSVLKSRMDKMLRFVKKEDEAYISTGSCRLCKPCKRKQNKPCAHPKGMTYSFEALGVDVSALTQKLFGITLLWYKDKVCPEYTCVVGGIVSNRQIADKEILDVLNQLV